MSERKVPAPHYVYDEATNLESFSVSRLQNLITAQVAYVDDVTPIPQQGQIAEFHVLGTSVQAIVNHTSLMSSGDQSLILIQAMRLQD